LNIGCLGNQRCGVETGDGSDEAVQELLDDVTGMRGVSLGHRMLRVRDGIVTRRPSQSLFL